MAVAQSPPPVAPDPKFWVRYSANQELPISSLSSIAVHVGVLAVLAILFGYLIGGSHDSAMPIEVFDAGIENAGGGGNVSGAEVSKAPGGPSRVERNIEDFTADTPKANTSLGGFPDPIILPDLPENPNANRSADSSEAKSRLDSVAKSTNQPPGSKGAGGKGSGGGKGAGTGPGEGTGDVAGTQGSIRQKRNKRWTLSFNTIGGTDYLHQLSLLGATLVGDYHDGARIMYRRLDAKPVPPEPIDPEIHKCMVWVDERPSAVRELADAMGLDRTPAAIKAYFPFKLETELLQMELKYRGKKEEEIHSTIFRVFSEGSGGYRLVVSEQRYN